MKPTVSDSGDLALKRGFTMVELVVAVSMMAILAAITIPAISRYLEGSNITSTANTLSDFEEGIRLFQTDIGNSPFRLSQLARMVTANDTTSCSGIGAATPRTTFTAANAAKWAFHGPYYPKAINVQGFPLPIGTASDTILRTTASLTPGFLQIQIPKVTFDDAVQLNTAIDGATDVNQANRSNTTGAIQWGVPTSQDIVTLTYNLPVSRVC